MYIYIILVAMYIAVGGRVVYIYIYIYNIGSYVYSRGR